MPIEGGNDGPAPAAPDGALLASAPTRPLATPRGTEPANALSPLRTRFITAIAGIVFLGILSIACAVALVKGDHPHALPLTILVICVVFLLTAVADAAYLLRRLRRELPP